MAPESSDSTSGFSDRGAWKSPHQDTERSGDPSQQAATARDQTLPEDAPNQTGQASFPLNPISGWWKGAVLSLVGTPILFLVLFGATYVYLHYPSTLTMSFIGIAFFFMVFLRLLLPYSLYKDAKKLTTAQEPIQWRPNRILYLLGTLFVPPPFEYLAASMYMYRRHNAVGRP